MMDTILVNWRELAPETQIIIVDGVKIVFLLFFTLKFKNKMQQWLIPFELENCFSIPSLDKKKSKRLLPWLSTFLAYGMCLSLAGFIFNRFIVEHPLWYAMQDQFLMKFWGVLLCYILLMCLLKQGLTAINELLKNPVIEQLIEKKFVNVENSQTHYQSIPLATKIIHFSSYALYFAIAWVLELMLIVEFFELALFSSLLSSLMLSMGKVLVALLMLYIAFKFYARQANQDFEHTNLSALVLVCCVLLGTLIIGGSNIVISSIPWLFLLMAIWLFLLSPDKETISNLIAGIYLKVTRPVLNNQIETFKINSLGFFESEIIHSSGKLEKIKNSKLLIICSDVENSTSETN